MDVSGINNFLAVVLFSFFPKGASKTHANTHTHPRIERDRERKRVGIGKVYLTMTSVSAARFLVRFRDVMIDQIKSAHQLVAGTYGVSQQSSSSNPI